MEELYMKWKRTKLFCDINPTCYAISEKKEILKRHIKNFIKNKKFANTLQNKKLPHLISNRSTVLIKKGKGIDPILQQNKVVNINLACSKIDGLVIHPGEEFSFWLVVGKTTKKQGYKEGRSLIRNKVTSGVGGGLCNLANTINWLILHSPLDVTELHCHSDAIDPDRGERVLLNAGTSVSYNYIDYRFKNNTDQSFQLLLWCDDKNLNGELRSERELPYKFELEEKDHYFHKEENEYFRISKIYKNTIEKTTGEIINRKLVLDNHSKVMYDYELIPKQMIR